MFSDAGGKMNLSVAEVGGGILAISQFTLYGNADKGRRPSFVDAATPEHGQHLYEVFCDTLTVPVGRGVFDDHPVLGGPGLAVGLPFACHQRVMPADG